MVVAAIVVLSEGSLQRRCFENIQEMYQGVGTVWESTLEGVGCLGLRYAKRWNKKDVTPQPLGNNGRYQQC